MSVGGFTLVSVISPGAGLRAPGGCGEAPLTRETLALADAADHGEVRGLNGRRLYGPGLDGRAGLDGRGVLAEGRGGGLAEVRGCGVAGAELRGVGVVVVGVETTGWSPGAAAITQVGAVRRRAGGGGWAVLCGGPVRA